MTSRTSPTDIDTSSSSSPAPALAPSSALLLLCPSQTLTLSIQWKRSHSPFSSTNHPLKLKEIPVVLEGLSKAPLSVLIGISKLLKLVAPYQFTSVRWMSFFDKLSPINGFSRACHFDVSPLSRALRDIPLCWPRSLNGSTSWEEMSPKRCVCRRETTWQDSLGMM